MHDLAIIAGVAAAFATAAVTHSAIKAYWRVKVRPKVKGRRGEAAVSRVTARYRMRGGHTFNDILIPAWRGTSQIDNILVSRSGITLIETKDKGGIITGGEGDAQWYQTFPNSKNVIPFQNPIQQNAGHAAALRNILKDAGFQRDEIPIFSYVVFTDPNCKIPQIPFVVDTDGLKRHLKIAHKECEDLLTDKEVRAVCDAIENSLVKGRKARKQHVLRAQLAAETAKHAGDESGLDYLIRVSNEMPNDLPVQDYSLQAQMPEKPSREKFTDHHAMLTIKNRTASIADFFESAKRRNDKEPVPVGGSFDYFVCPYTFKRFPAEQAMDFYRGLWVAYLTKNPGLADYMKEHGTADLGNSTRVRKILAGYNTDKDAFVRSVRSTDWYRNVKASNSKTRNQAPGSQKAEPAENRRAPLEQQINGARDKCEPAHSGKPHTHMPAR